MTNIQKLAAITLLVLTMVGCDSLTGKKDDKGKNNLLVVGAFLLSQKASNASPEAFYVALTSKTESYTANAIASNSKKTWTFNADNTVQTVTTFGTGTGSADGTVFSTAVNTYAGGYLIKSVVTGTTSAGACFGATFGSGSYTLDYSNFSGKNAQTRKCTPGTTTGDTISDVVTFENGLTKTQATTYSVTVASNSYVAFTYAGSVMTDYKFYSGATTADATKLSFGIEAVDSGTAVTWTNSSYTAGANKTKTSETVYTISGGQVTRVLASNFTSGAVTFSSLVVYAYTGTASFTQKSYSAIGATVVTESSTPTSSSANTYSSGLLTKVETFNTTSGAVTNTNTYTYVGSVPATLVVSNASLPSFSSCTAYLFTEATKTVTATTDFGTTTCSAGATRTVKTITHNGFSSTNFNGFTDNESRSLTQAGKISYAGDTALRAGENQKLFAFLGL